MEGLIIRNKGGLLQPMTFLPSQEILWSFVDPRLNAEEKLWFIVLKGRQVSCTTFFMALAFIRTMAKPLTDSLVIGQDLFTAANIFGIAKRFHQHLPLPKLREPRVKEIDFPFPEGASRLRVVSAGNMAKGRGTTQTIVHATEVAFWPQPEVMVGLFQAMPDLGDTMWVLESTANGMLGNGKMFYDQWKSSIGGKSDLTPIFIPWYVMPEYHMSPGVPEDEWDDEEKELYKQFSKYGLDAEAIAWRRYAINTKTEGILELFRQEYPSSPREAFLTSGLPAFDHLALMSQEQYVSPALSTGVMIDKSRLANRVEPVLTKQPRGWIQIWKEPIENHQYALGVDTSEGIKGGDYACAQLVDMGTLEQVAVLHGMLSPWDLAQQLNLLGRWYNNAVLAVELANTGRAVQDYLIRIFNYPHLHVWQGRQDSIRPAGGKLYGWDTNVWSRPLLIEAGRRAVNTKLVTIRDEATLEELQHFSRIDTGKYEATSGHDDRVMALLIALRSREENYAPARKLVVSNEYSLGDSMPHGFHVVHTPEDKFQLRAKLHQQLIERSKKSTKSWLQL